MEDQKYYIPDIESGHHTEVTKEQYERYRSSIESFRSNLNNEYKGMPILCGTAGALQADGDLEQLFYNPGPYNILPYEPKPPTPKYVVGVDPFRDDVPGLDKTAFTIRLEKNWFRPEDVVAEYQCRPSDIVDAFRDTFYNRTDKDKSIRLYCSKDGRRMFLIQIKNFNMVNRLKRKYVRS